MILSWGVSGAYHRTLRTRGRGGIGLCWGEWRLNYPKQIEFYRNEWWKGQSPKKTSLNRRFQFKTKADCAKDQVCVHYLKCKRNLLSLEKQCAYLIGFASFAFQSPNYEKYPLSPQSQLTLHTGTIHNVLGNSLLIDQSDGAGSEFK